MPESYVAVATARQIPVGRSIGVTVAGQAIALFNLGGEVVAVENRCPHQGAPLAGSPILGASRVRCALHGWMFDLRATEEEDGLRRYPARLGDDGVIEVSVEEAARDPV